MADLLLVITKETVLATSELRIEYTSLAALIPTTRNAKLHDEAGIRASILRFGFAEPLLIVAGGQKGAGTTGIIEGKGTPGALTIAEGRHEVRGKSPEQPPAKMRVSAETQKAIKALGPDWAEDVQSLYKSPVHMMTNISFLTDARGGLDVVKGILRDHGLMPDKASWKQADDLLATRYTEATPAQNAWQKLRAMGTAIAAGEDPELVISYMNRNGPTQEDMAIRSARRAGQAPDLNDPDVAVYDRSIATPD